MTVKGHKASFFIVFNFLNILRIPYIASPKMMCNCREGRPCLPCYRHPDRSRTRPKGGHRQAGSYYGVQYI